MGKDSITKVCIIEGCNGKHLAKGWCSKHYWRSFRHGSTELLPTKNPASPIFSPEDKDLYTLRWSLHTGGYAQAGGHDGSNSLAHRMVLGRILGRDLQRGEVTDHINRNKLDNRRENLRLADKSLNSINRAKRPDNTSGYVGVYLYWPKEWQVRGWAKRYRPHIERKGVGKIALGYYKTPLEAHQAREKYLKEVLGE